MNRSGAVARRGGSSVPVGAPHTGRRSLLGLALVCLVWLQTPSTAWAGEDRWFVILGSLTQTPAGLQQAHSLADQVARQLSMTNLIVSETAFYPELTPNLYVVMLGPYLSSANAQWALRDSGVRRLISDAYVKQAETLHSQGFSLMLSSFRSTLAPLRRERRAA